MKNLKIDKEIKKLLWSQKYWMYKTDEIFEDKLKENMINSDEAE